MDRENETAGLADRYYLEFASAFVRGRMGLGGELEAEEVVALGLRAGLRLYGFKRAVELARVRRVVGILRGVAPETLLDVGCGRGTSLWPMLDAFPNLPVLAVDRSAQRTSDVGAVASGGLARLSVARMDAERLAVHGGIFDVVTILEVLEHLPRPERAVAGAVRAARRFVIASVPRHEDDNPEHIHLFDERSLRQMFLSAQATRVGIEYVLGHMIAVARVEGQG